MSSSSRPSWLDAGNLPTIPPPPGIKSNFATHVSLCHWDILTQAICLTIATLVVSMRIFTKGILLKNLWWDDWTACISWVGLLVAGVLCLEQDRFGNGRHLWDVKGDDFTQYLKLVYAANMVYAVTIFFTKLSILLLYFRVFRPNKGSRLVLQIVIYCNLAFYTVGLFIEAFQCIPMQRIWLPLYPGSCINQRALQLASAIFNLLSDLVILCLPVASVWKLNTHRRGKVGIMVIFATGILACIASSFRTYLIVHNIHVLDGTWDLYSFNLWSTAEMACGLIVGCLPALPTFVRHISGLPVKILVSNPSARSRNPSAGIRLNSSSRVADFRVEHGIRGKGMDDDIWRQEVDSYK